MAYQAVPGKSQFGHPQVHLNDAGVEEGNGGETFSLKLPFDFNTADAAVLYTVPANLRVMVDSALWEITTGFTGGTSSAIGVSSSQSPHDAKGDILGGASGDLAATLVVGVKRGTQGLSFTAAPNCVVLDAGATIRFDRIASVYTAGVGFIHLALRTIG